jgi:hypothetical protein
LPRPSWSDVEQHLEAAASAEADTLGLDILNAAEVGPRSLAVYCASGRFCVTLWAATADDHNVRVLNPIFVKSSASMTPRDMTHPDFFPTNAICDDFNLIKRIVKEFFETGDVSRDLLA